MKHLFLFVLLCHLVSVLPAQFYEYFDEVSVLPCPFDDEVDIIWPAGWMVYHTLDNKWNGDVDSAWCISVEQVVEPPYTRMYIGLDQMDTTRPLFMRYTGSDLPTPLAAHSVYTFEVAFEMLEASLNVDPDDPSASAMILVVDIPDMAGTGRSERINEISIQDSVEGVWSSACIPSEKFDSQAVKEVVVRLSLNNAAAEGHALSLHYMNLYYVGFEGRIDRHGVPEIYWQDTAYYAPLAILSSEPWVTPFLLEHLTPGYPSSQNIHFHEVYPEVYSDTAQTLTLFIDPYQAFVPEPFTSLRGALVEGMEPHRHRVVLENGGGDMCIFVVELQFDDGTTYAHKSGRIDIGSNRSCMMFKSGSTLEVAEDAVLEYGHGGVGFLATKEGARVVLRENAQLAINNTWVLQHSLGTSINPAVYLHPGSNLSFGANGVLDNWDNDLKLDVHMLGGQLDDRLLDPDSRALINKISPPTPIQHRDARHLAVKLDRGSQIAYVGIPDGYSGRSKIVVTDMTGRMITASDIVPMQEEWQWYYGALPAGIYLVSYLGEDIYTGLAPVE